MKEVIAINYILLRRKSLTRKKDAGMTSSDKARVGRDEVLFQRNYSYVLSLCTPGSQEIFRFSFLFIRALEIRALV